MTSPSAEPGWYPDPSGVPGQRYFDGTTWTEHTTPGGESSAEPVAGTVPQAPVAAAGWYPDPSGSPSQRYFDGTTWTEHTSQPPQQQQFQVNQQVVIAGGAAKSPGLAFLLGLIFGPLGMLYATVPGAVIMFFGMLVSCMVIGFITAGFGLIFWVPICLCVCGIWAASAASRSGGLRVQQGAAG